LKKREKKNQRKKVQSFHHHEGGSIQTINLGVPEKGIKKQYKAASLARKKKALKGKGGEKKKKNWKECFLWTHEPRKNRGVDKLVCFGYKTSKRAPTILTEKKIGRPNEN